MPGVPDKASARGHVGTRTNQGDVYSSPDSLKLANFETCQNKWVAGYSPTCYWLKDHQIQVNLDMTDSMGPGKLVRHMQNLSYTYDEYLIYIRLGPSISSVICKNPSYSGPSYPSSPVLENYW